MNSGSTRLLAAIGVASASYGLGAVLVFSNTVSNWFAPWEPFLFTGVGLTALACSFVGIVDVVLAQQGLPGLPTQRVVAMVAALGLLSGLVGSSWTLPGMRLKGVEYLAAQGDFDGLRAALKDRDHGVRVRACVTLALGGREEDEPALLESMAASHDMALDCLAQIAHVARGRELADVVAVRLYAAAMDHAAALPQKACQLIQGAAQTNASPEIRGAAFLSCMLTADAEPVRECCAQALGRLHPDSAALAQLIAEAPGDVERLMSVALRGAFVTAPADSADVLRASRAGMHDAPFRAAAISRACEVLRAPQAAVDLVPTMNSLVEASACPELTRPFVEGRRVWAQLCQGLQPAIEQGVDPARSLCVQAHLYVVDGATRAAAAIVLQALRRPDERGLADAIEVGHARASSGQQSLQAHAQRILEAAGQAGQMNERSGLAAMEILRGSGDHVSSQALQSAMAMAAGQDLPNLMDVFGKFEENFDSEKLMSLEAFENLPEDKRDEFLRLLEKYKAFKDDPVQRERLTKLQTDLEERTKATRLRMQQEADQAAQSLGVAGVKAAGAANE